MKKIIVLLFILFNINSFSQELTKPTSFSYFSLGFLGGINYTAFTGPSLIIEGKTNLTEDINLKLSIGYSGIYKNDFQDVKTYDFIDIGNIQKFSTYSYNINKIEYDVVPISIGLEYTFGHDEFLPYCFGEAGLNIYSSKFLTSSPINTGNYYDRNDEVPPAYQNSRPTISEGKSYRLGLGIGTKYQISPKFDLDIRYLYQFNNNIIDTHQILIGFSY